MSVSCPVTVRPARLTSQEIDSAISAIQNLVNIVYGNKVRNAVKYEIEEMNDSAIVWFGADYPDQAVLSCARATIEDALMDLLWDLVTDIKTSLK